MRSLSPSERGSAEIVGTIEQRAARVQRRTLWVVVVAQALAGAGLAAALTVGALLAQDMLGTESLAGIPAGATTLGAATCAYLVGRVTQRLGRRLGLTAGFALGAVGSAGVVIAAAVDSVALLFVSLFLYGAGNAANLQCRYAGTDLALPTARGTAVSVAMVSTTFGALAGPNLVGPLGRLAAALGLPSLSGPFLLSAVAFALAGLVLFVLLRPDPLLLARRVAEDAQEQAAPHDASTPDNQASSAARPGAEAYVGATIMVLMQISMVAIMTMTPVHMRQYHAALGDIGLVIGLHIAAMYLPAPLTGLMVDRMGRIPVAILSGVVMLTAGVAAATGPGDSLGFTILAMVLLGWGWNLGLVCGTTLVVDATVPAQRPRVQGTIDVLVSLSGAGGGILSGVVVATTSYPVLALAGGLLALAMVPALIWAAPRRRGPVTP